MSDADDAVRAAASDYVRSVADRLIMPVDRIQDDTADALRRGDVDALLRAHLVPSAWEPQTWANLNGVNVVTVADIKASLDALFNDVDAMALRPSVYAQGHAPPVNAESLPEPVEALHGICAECGAYWRCEHQGRELPDEEHAPMADVGPGFAVGPNRATVAGILDDAWRDRDPAAPLDPYDASAALRAIAGGPSTFLDYALRHPAQLPVGDPTGYAQINTPPYVPPAVPPFTSQPLRIPQPGDILPTSTLMGVEVASDVVAAYMDAEQHGASGGCDALFQAMSGMVDLYGSTLGPRGTGRPTLWALWDFMRDRQPEASKWIEEYARRFADMNQGRRWIVG